MLSARSRARGRGRPGAQSDARAGTECNGLLICIPVAGPWVKIPQQSGSPPTADLLPPELPAGRRRRRARRRGDASQHRAQLRRHARRPDQPRRDDGHGGGVRRQGDGQDPAPDRVQAPARLHPGRRRQPRPDDAPAHALAHAPPPPSAAIRPCAASSRSGSARAVPSTGTLRCRPDERLISYAHAVAFHMKRAADRAGAVGGRRAGECQRRPGPVTGEAGSIVSGLPVRVQIQVVCARPNP